MSALALSKLEDALRAIETAQANVQAVSDLVPEHGMVRAVSKAALAEASWHLGTATGALLATREALAKVQP